MAVASQDRFHYNKWQGIAKLDLHVMEAFDLQFMELFDLRSTKVV